MAKLRKQIELAVRRRARLERPQAEQPVRLQVTSAERESFTTQHAITLLNVESALVQIAAQMPEVDDHVVEVSLRATIRSRPAANQVAQDLAGLLEQVRVVEQIDVETWHTALRVIYTSVTTVSDCRRDEYTYLAFAASFLHRTGAL